jgi:hypothetical protein
MKKSLFAAMLLALVIVMPIPAMADVNISIGIPLPPVIIVGGPIEVIVIPDTYIYDVYVIPDIEVDIFFCRGWWWRLWEGRWYRSRHYDRGWIYYKYIPDFYYDIDFGWRGFYRNRDWHGHRWDYRRIPYQQLEQNWRSWNSSRYWERERKWDVERYQPLPPQRQQELRKQRQYEYARRPEVQKHEEWKREQQRQPQVRKPQGQQQRQPQVRKPQGQQQRQPQVQKPQGQQQRQPQVPHPQHSQPQGKPEGGKPGQKK